MNILSIHQLSVYAGETCLVEPVSFALEKGERLVILGQTGSGKSLLAQAIMGNLPASLTMQGEVSLLGQPMDSHARRRALWGKTISMLPQEPWNALSPLMSSSHQLEETYHLVAGHDRASSKNASQETLQRQGLSASGGKRVDQLSGGMAQRVAIACAMAGGAPLLLADEPTKGLDVSRRDQVVAQLMAQSEQGALVIITHDIAVARQVGGRIMVFRDGQCVEQGETQSVLAAPQHAFTQTLIAADPARWPLTPSSEIHFDTRLLTVEGLTVVRGQQILSEATSFTLHQGEVIGVVGDSGCGKSTLGDTLLGLLPYPKGSIIRHHSGPAQHWQKLYQDPTAAVSHAVPLQVLLDDVVKRHRVPVDRIPPLMDKLGLDEVLLQRHANEISGGELQRFCLLRTLLLDPVFLFADEPTSRLDPVTAQEVSAMLVAVARETGCAVILVSHDPHLIEKRCDRVIRMGH